MPTVPDVAEDSALADHHTRRVWPGGVGALSPSTFQPTIPGSGRQFRARIAVCRIRAYCGAVHPLSSAYYRRELRFMDALRPATIGSVALSRESGPRPASGYMYVENRRTPLRNVPVLRFNGEVWMSLTPMEVQSAFMPIRLARGRVGTAGLGLGYFVQRVLHKPNVDRVVVYELDKDVLELYCRNFGSHAKLELHHANARRLKGEQWDFFSVDFYKDLLTPAAIGDMADLCAANIIGAYHWSSIEQTVLEVLCPGLQSDCRCGCSTRTSHSCASSRGHVCPRNIQVFGCGAALIEDLERRALRYDEADDGGQIAATRGLSHGGAHAADLGRFRTPVFTWQRLGLLLVRGGPAHTTCVATGVSHASGGERRKSSRQTRSAR